MINIITIIYQPKRISILFRGVSWQIESEE
nr:MAG TPA: hypothetical protein [Caudoviricetes sp.]